MFLHKPQNHNFIQTLKHQDTTKGSLDLKTKS